MFRDGGISVIEWGERAGDALPRHTVRVDIELGDDGTRKITIEGWDL